MPVRFRPRAPQIRPEASTSFRPFSFSLWEVALTSARTCVEVCRNPGVCGGTNGGTFWKSGGTSLHVPPTRAAQAGPLVLVGCLMTPVARHYPPGWPCHNLTPLERVTQQCAGAARITRTAQSQGEPTSGGRCPPSTVHPFKTRCTRASMGLELPALHRAREEPLPVASLIPSRSRDGRASRSAPHATPNNVHRRFHSLSAFLPPLAFLRGNSGNSGNTA